MQVLAQMRIAAEYLGTPGQGNIGDTDVAEFAMEMQQVFDQQFLLGPHVVSPLKLAGNEWDLAVAFLDRIGDGRVALWDYPAQ